MTSSVGVIKSDNILTSSNSTVKSLQGLVPGLAIVDRGGAPGRNSTVMRIRGNTSLQDGNNEALILVDGIEQRIEDVNPNDIESVSILKDAAATSIYGSRAANGVIMVTTKRATGGKLSVNYNGYYGFQNVISKPKHMESVAYMRQQNIAHNNVGQADAYPEEYIQEWMHSGDRYKYPLVNTWQDAVFRTAPQQNHGLTVSGGNDLVKGIMSLRYYDQDGIIPGFNSDIKEMRVNTDFNVTSKLKISLDANYRLSYAMEPAEAGEIYRTLKHAAQFTVPQYEDGSYGISGQGNNPLMYAKESGTNENYKRLFFGNLKADYEIIDGLKASLQYAYKVTNDKDKTFRNVYSFTDPETNYKKEVQENKLEENRFDQMEYTTNVLLEYNKTFGKHNLTALGGFSRIVNKYTEIKTSRTGFYNNDVTSMDMGSTATMSNSGFDTEWALQSWFGRVNYNYDDRYLLEANVWYDGSSRFTGSNQYAFFPSFSAGWRLSNEAFWSDIVETVSNLKLRASWGETGNQSAGLYSFYDSYSTQKYAFGGVLVDGYKQTVQANKDLKWESTKQLNIGVDIGLFNNRLNFEFDYYRKKTDGVLLELPIPQIVGLDAPYQNAAIVENKGFELSVGYRGGTTFKYDLSFNISNNWNKILDMAGASPIIQGETFNAYYIKQVGSPVKSFYGLKTDGLFQTEEEIANSALYDPNTKPGDVKYVDLNNDGVIDSNDFTELGTDYPFLPFGLSGNFSYKNFDARLTFQGVIKQKARISGALAEFGNYAGFVLDIFEDYWTEDNPGARFPRPSKSVDYNSVMSDFWLIDCGYLRMKEITIGYTIPRHITQKWHIDRLRVYVTGNNLFTISGYNEWGLDPEMPSGRYDYFPQTKVYTLGLNVTF
ncbi:MAG: TonB-dependent receptor [Tannerellaceae bacterium]|nr:TonB-dependent receptor [Tannerellaceae bacterium]